MSTYQFFEASLLGLALLLSLWGALRKAAPKFSLMLGEQSRRAGLNTGLSEAVFGKAAACQSGCGSCGGCEKPAGATTPAAPVRMNFQRKP